MHHCTSMILLFLYGLLIIHTSVTENHCEFPNYPIIWFYFWHNLYNLPLITGIKPVWLFKVIQDKNIYNISLTIQMSFNRLHIIWIRIEEAKWRLIDFSVIMVLSLLHFCSMSCSFLFLVFACLWDSKVDLFRMWWMCLCSVLYWWTKKISPTWKLGGNFL